MNFSHLIEEVSAEEFIILDESGANLSMTREYGRSVGGQRLHCPRPYLRGSHYSIMSAISPNKVVASLYCEGAVNGDIFTSFIEECLVPELTLGNKVVMDNVSFHKVASVEKLIKQTGAQILYLPPYSPDLSPIELMWSKIKALLRKFAARTAEEFFSAMQAAFRAINTDDLRGWFQHCGYRIKQL